ncbi:MAG: hypothetical protein KDC87_19070, partial [Planctomycetes bacterium]|nr:hypothetical protein [Planctomycetota bacterium]
MFVPEKMSVVGAAQRSHAMEVSQRALRLLGDGVPEPMRRVFQLDETAPATAPAGPGLQPIGREPAKK